MSLLSNRGLVWIVCGCFLTGCGGRGDRPQLGTVTGTIFMDEKPLPNVWVMFVPTSGRTSMARTNEAGRYDLMYLDRVKGANLGTHKVMITTYNEDEIEEMKANANGPVKEPIPAKYNSKTTLTEEVNAGKNVIDIHLESK